MNQVHDVYESMVVSVARVGREVSGVDRALRDAIHHVAHAIPWIESGAEPAIARFAAHEAYLSVIGIGQHLLDARDAGHAEVAPALRAVNAVLDAFEPYVVAADRQVRHVLLDGLPLSAALRRLAAG
jgi:hypothetical protein